MNLGRGLAVDDHGVMFGNESVRQRVTTSHQHLARRSPHATSTKRHVTSRACPTFASRRRYREARQANKTRMIGNSTAPIVLLSVDATIFTTMLLISSLSSKRLMDIFRSKKPMLLIDGSACLANFRI